jgi:hypothetical protein
MITVEEVFKRYASSYRDKDIIVSYLLDQLSRVAYKFSKLDDTFGIVTLMLNLIHSRVLFYKVPLYLAERIKDEIKDSYYSETLILLAKKHAVREREGVKKLKPSHVVISKGVSLIYKSCSEDEGDEFILEEDSKFVVIDGIHKKHENEEGGYYFE